MRYWSNTLQGELVKLMEGQKGLGHPMALPWEKLEERAEKQMISDPWKQSEQMAENRFSRTCPQDDQELNFIVSFKEANLREGEHVPGESWNAPELVSQLWLEIGRSLCLMHTLVFLTKFLNLLAVHLKHHNFLFNFSSWFSTQLHSSLTCYLQIQKAKKQQWL